MNYKNGDYVRVTVGYRVERFQGVTGVVVEQPDEGHQNQYQIKLDGDVAQNRELTGLRVWVARDFLEPALKTPPSWSTNDS